jgi:phytoene dehydrogenase-like protein
MDAVVIGSGPNGLSAAIVLATAGYKVVVFEAEHTIGGGARSAELTLPGFVHDVCSAVHPFAIASPFWRTLPLAAHGLEWIEPPGLIGHPFDDGGAILVERSLDATAAMLRRDGDAYRKMIGTVVENWARLERTVLGPFSVPRHPFVLARFGWHALRSAEGLAKSAFKKSNGRGRCSRASPRTACCRSTTR